MPQFLHKGQILSLHLTLPPATSPGRPNLCVHIWELGPCPGTPLSTRATLVIFVITILVHHFILYSDKISLCGPPLSWAHVAAYTDRSGIGGMLITRSSYSITCYGIWFLHISKSHGFPYI